MDSLDTSILMLRFLIKRLFYIVHCCIPVNKEKKKESKLGKRYRVYANLIAKHMKCMF